MTAAATSFYVTGGTLRPDAPSYVERQADRDLYDGLSRGEFCYVLTSRQMGQSSLMARTAARLRTEGVAVVILDLTAIGQNVTVEHGRLLASGSYDRTVKLWAVTAKREIATLKGPSQEIEAVALPSDGRTLAAAGHDRTIRLWDIAARRPVADLVGHTQTITSLSFSPDGRTLASVAFDSSVRLWDVPRGRLVATMFGHVGNVLAVAFSPDGNFLATGGGDTTIRLWRAAPFAETDARSRRTDRDGARPQAASR